MYFLSSSFQQGPIQLPSLSQGTDAAIASTNLYLNENFYVKIRLVLLRSARLVEPMSQYCMQVRLGQSKEVLLLLQSPYHRANSRLMMVSTVVFLCF